MKDVAVIIFKAPEGIILNQKDQDYWHPSAITFFGGSIEEGDTPKQAIQREIGEETSLDPDAIDIKSEKTYQIAGKNFHLYSASLGDADFEVFEGTGMYIIEPDVELDKINFAEKTRIILKDYLGDNKS